MASAYWTESTWVKIICVMGGIILLMSGALLGQTFLGAKVNDNTVAINNNTAGIKNNTIQLEHFEQTTNKTLEVIAINDKLQTELLNNIDKKLAILEERSK